LNNINKSLTLTSRNGKRVVQLHLGMTWTTLIHVSYIFGMVQRRP